MARKKKNKKEQTFNVYPYLGGYQHFMRNGGALPKFEETGQVDIQDVLTHIKPTNRYKYDRTFDGVTEEWKNNVGNIDDRDKYNSLGGLGSMGLFANLLKGGFDLTKNITGAFNKDSYAPGGKYSKFDEDGSLRFGRVNLQNTRDENALLHGENLQKYLKMSNKERENLIASGDMRNEDLWWTPDELTYGKWNWMDRNEDGTARYDGINYQVAKKRSEHYRNPDQGTCSKPEFTNAADCDAGGGEWTGDKLFSIKQKNRDGTFTYFNEDGSVDGTKSGQTEYDVIEESKGAGGLGDINAQSMIFDFDQEGDNKLSGFTSFDEITETKSMCSDGTSLTEVDCIANGGTWEVSDPTSRTELTPHEYNPDEKYGPYTETIIKQEESDQQKLNREAVEKAASPEDEARYGRELRKYTIGGAGQDDQSSNTFTGSFNSDQFKDDQAELFYKYGGTLPKFQEEGENEEETIDEKEERMYKESLVELPPSDTELKFDSPAANFALKQDDPFANMDWMQPGAPGVNPTDPINLQPEPESNWEEPNNINKLKNWFKGDAHLNKDPGPDYANNAAFDASIAEKNEAHANNPRVLDPASRTDMEGAAPGFTCSDGTSKTREECEANGGTWDDPKDMGVDVSYGDGPIQSTWNKGREFFNTGPVGAVKDVYGKASAFVVDKAVPFLEDIYNRNVNKQNEMHKRSVSAEDVAPIMEENVGTGDRGFHNINAGGYGDSLYGTGPVYGQDGLEMEQQSDLSGVVNFMEPSFDGLKYRDEYLARQKTYLGKMNTGGQPKLFRFLNGGNTGSEGAVLCDAYDKPVGPTNPEFSKADYDAPVLPYDDPDGKGTGPECAIPGTCPGMKYGGALPKFQGPANSEVNTQTIVSKDANRADQAGRGLVDAFGNPAIRIPNNPYIGVNDGTSEFDLSGITMGFVDSDGKPILPAGSSVKGDIQKIYTDRSSDNLISSDTLYHHLPTGGVEYYDPEKRFGGALPRYNDKGETSNWNLSGWLKGEQGIIPDFKGESTKTTISENPTVNNVLDKSQTALTVGGMQDYLGPAAVAMDAINTGISGARAYAAPDGSDQKTKHTENMALNAMSMVPGAGLASASASLAKDTATYAGVLDDQSLTKTVADSTKDSGTTNMAENMSTTKKVGDTAKYGGEEVADIDMDLYYKLMKAGANIQIIG